MALIWEFPVAATLLADCVPKSICVGVPKFCPSRTAAVPPVIGPSEGMAAGGANAATGGAAGVAASDAAGTGGLLVTAAGRGGGTALLGGGGVPFLTLRGAETGVRPDAFAAGCLVCRTMPHFLQRMVCWSQSLGMRSVCLHPGHVACTTIVMTPDLRGVALGDHPADAPARIILP